MTKKGDKKMIIQRKVTKNDSNIKQILRWVHSRQNHHNLQKKLVHQEGGFTLTTMNLGYNTLFSFPFRNIHFLTWRLMQKKIQTGLKFNYRKKNLYFLPNQADIQVILPQSFFAIEQKLWIFQNWANFWLVLIFFAPVSKYNS